MQTNLLRVANPANSENTSPGESPRIAPIDVDLFRNVSVTLDAKLGDVRMTIEEMMALKPGAVVTLKTSLADHVELFLNGALVARGEIVAVGDNYGVRILEIAPKS